ncbi:MAG: ABC transporter substrate-binding protein [Chloroflexi bacterium]|nr:ABC transporter substrate-binding protein [Chloroflexota bacterium]
MNLRNILPVVLVMLMAAVFPITQHPAQAQDSVIIIGTTDMPDTLDPAQSNDFLSWEILRHLYVGLTRQVPGTNTYELALAESHTVSEDGLTHTFTIRDDAAFADGTPITAQDFAGSINRVLNLDYAGAVMLEDIGLSVEVSEDDELVMTTNRPIPYFEGLVSLPLFFAVPESDFPADDVVQFPTSLTGNGVMTLANFNPGDEIELRANPDYAFGELAKTDTVILRHFNTSEDLRVAMQTGAIDMAWRSISLPDADELVEDNEDVQLVTTPSIRMWYLVFNKRFDYVDDPVVRESVLLTIDRDQIVTEDFGGYLTAAYSLVPEMVEGAYNLLWNIEPDPATAVQNMLDAGYREARFNRATFAISSSQPGYGDLRVSPIASILRDARPIRTLTLGGNTLIELPVFIEALTAGDYQAALFPWTPAVAHPHAYLYPLLHSDGLLAVRNNYESDEIDELLDEAVLLDDVEAQNENYQQVQTLIEEDASLVPLWQDVLIVAAQPNISGIQLEANFYLHYDLLEKQ